MAKLGVSELRNLWTDCHKIRRALLRRRFDPAYAKIQTDGHNGASRQMGEISLTWFLVFLFCDHKFFSRLELKPENRFLLSLFRMMSIPCYCIPRGFVLSFVRSLRAGVQPTLGPSAETSMSVQCASPGRGGELVGVCGVCARYVGWRKE